jgi:hypothetical protein
MTNNLPQTLKLKAILISTDAGRSWLISRQFFLLDVKTDKYLDQEIDGTRLAVIEEDDHGDASKSRD